MRKVCFRLNPGVRFSVDFVGESGDGVYLSLISVRISAEISSLALAMFARPVSEKTNRVSMVGGRGPFDG